MFSPETLRKLNVEEVTYNSPEVLECRSRCNKRCCINCEQFLSTEISTNHPGVLLSLICSLHYDDPTDVKSGTNQCTRYKKP